MAWQIKYADGAVKELAKLDRQVSHRIVRFLDEHVSTAPDLKALAIPLVGRQGLWRFRVGDYRLICEIRDNELIVLVLEVGHRREVYR